jgi:hypothetical protein
MGAKRLGEGGEDLRGMRCHAAMVDRHTRDEVMGTRARERRKRGPDKARAAGPKERRLRRTTGVRREGGLMVVVDDEQAGQLSVGCKAGCKYCNQV